MLKIRKEYEKTSQNQETWQICFDSIIEYATVGTPVDYQQKLCLAHKKSSLSLALKTEVQYFIYIFTIYKE